MRPIFLQLVILSLTVFQYAFPIITKRFGERPRNIENLVAELVANIALPCRNLLQASFAGANVFLEEATTSYS